MPKIKAVQEIEKEINERWFKFKSYKNKTFTFCCYHQGTWKEAREKLTKLNEYIENRDYFISHWYCGECEI